MNSNNTYAKLALLFIFMVGCHPENKIKLANEVTKVESDPARYKIKKPDLEDYLEYDSVKINGVLPLQTTIGKFTKVLGKPDSIITPNPPPAITYWDSAPDYCYYKSLFFEKYHDILIFRSIDFRKNPSLYLSIGKLHFSSTTTVADLKKWYSPAFESNRMSSNNMAKYHSLWLKLDKQGIYEDRWLFTFNNEDKLITIDYWIDD